MTSVFVAVESKVTKEMNDIITKPLTTEEVVRVLKQMHPNKALGDDTTLRFLFHEF